MGLLGHSAFGDENLVPIHLWWREIVLTREKACKYFVHDYLKIFFLVFTSLKMRGNSTNDHFFVEKSRTS